MKKRNGLITLTLVAAVLLVFLCAAYSGNAGERVQVSPAMTTPAPEITQPTVEPETVQAPVFHGIPTATDTEDEDESTEDTESSTDSTDSNVAAAVAADSSDYTATAVSDDIPESPAESGGNTESAPAYDEPATVENDEPAAEAEPEPEDEPSVIEAEQEPEYVILESGECVEVVECTGPATESEPEPEDEYIVTESGEIIVVCH